MIGANERRDREGRRPPEVQGRDDQDRPGFGPRSGIAHSWKKRWAVQKAHPGRDRRLASRWSFAPASRWAARAAASPTTRKSSRKSASAAWRPVADQRVADRRDRLIGWKEYEMEVVRDKQGQLHHRLLDRKPGPDGHPHRRLHHRGAGADADRQGISAAAQRLDRRACVRSAWIPAAPTCSSRSTRRTAAWWSSR